jgi:hypothetical protein
LSHKNATKDIKHEKSRKNSTPLRLFDNSKYPSKKKGPPLYFQLLRIYDNTAVFFCYVNDVKGFVNDINQQQENKFKKPGHKISFQQIKTEKQRQTLKVQRHKRFTKKHRCTVVGYPGGGSLEFGQVF